jgi:hypothetical protein
MRKSEDRRRDRFGLRASLGRTIAVLVLLGTMSSSHGAPRSQSRSSESEPTAARPKPSIGSHERVDAAYIFVKGAGILRLQDGAVSTVLQTQAALRDMQIDGEGAVWASLRGVGVVRIVGGQTVTLNQESFAKLAICSPTDVWTINDSHGSVVHYDGRRWKTVRTRNSLAGAFDDNRLLDIVTDGRAVWVAGWNGLWHILGGRWTRLEPPPAVASNDETGSDGPPAPAFPLSLLVSKPGLIACYLSGCFVSTETGWQPSHWPVDKAHLQSSGAANLAAGASADGRSVMVARLDGSGKASQSESLPATGINDIAIDPTGRVWVATGAELVVLDASGRTLHRWKTGYAGCPAGEIEHVVIAGAGSVELPAK